MRERRRPGLIEWLLIVVMVLATCASAYFAIRSIWETEAAAFDSG